MYRAEPEPYCYPGITVLINRLGFRDQSRLDAFEAEVTTERATQLLPAGRVSTFEDEQLAALKIHSALNHPSTRLGYG